MQTSKVVTQAVERAKGRLWKMGPTDLQPVELEGSIRLEVVALQRQVLEAFSQEVSAQVTAWYANRPEELRVKEPDAASG